MVLEATMICIDKSEWMRNGDYSLSRFQAQLMLLVLSMELKPSLIRRIWWGF
ncbi:hypothetical protein ERO13_D02G158525v2 [Gossypium hirsutum]|nr:hypothetical protein ERO13_D02G158525v2 [Gossypium hirsutum]